MVLDSMVLFSVWYDILLLGGIDRVCVLAVLQQQHGVMVADYHGQKQSVRLQLTEDALFIQKQELAYTYSPTDHVDAAILARVSEGTLIIINSLRSVFLTWSNIAVQLCRFTPTHMQCNLIRTNSKGPLDIFVIVSRIYYLR